MKSSSEKRHNRDREEANPATEKKAKNENPKTSIIPVSKIGMGFPTPGTMYCENFVFIRLHCSNFQRKIAPPIAIQILLHSP